MKRFVIALSAALLLAASPLFADVKIGYVDSDFTAWFGDNRRNLIRWWWQCDLALKLQGAEPGNAGAIGRALYSRFLFPFEITSMVLLVAMVGAIVMTKTRRPAGEERP